MASRPYILWLGPVVDEPTMLARGSAISPAANRWQLGLLTALQESGLRVVTVGHVPEASWPRGGLKRSAERDRLAPGLTGRLLSYWNAPFLRSRNLEGAYTSALRSLCASEGCPSAVLSYNDYAWNVAAGRCAQEKLGVPWVCVVADGPGAGSEYRAHEERIGGARGRIFLSWARFAESVRMPKLHLDGGVGSPRFAVNDPAPGKPVVLFSGAMTKWAGVRFLVEGFREVKRRDIELWLCGPGLSLDVERAVESDPRIRWLGLLGEQELKEASCQATVFVNPRPSSIPDNRTNFPSKVLEYLSYGRPVISTWTAGLSPEYRDVLVVLARETPATLGETIEEVVAWDDSKRRDNARRTLSFLTSKKLWSLQARTLVQWLTGEGLLAQPASVAWPEGNPAATREEHATRQQPRCEAVGGTGA